MPDYISSRRHEEHESFFCRFTFGQFFALLVLEVFTLFFVFYLGARYGRGLLGLDSAPSVALESARPEEAAESRVLTTRDPEVARMADELASRAGTPELKDRIKEMISDAQGGAVRERRPDVVAVERRAEPAAPPRPDPREEEPRREEFPMRQQERPSPDSARTVPDESVVRIKSAQHARYSVQIGSYPDMAEGTRVVEKWKARGYPAYMMIADIPDRGRWYRVRIGGFQSRQEATRYLDEFTARENVEALVVLNEQ